MRSMILVLILLTGCAGQDVPVVIDGGTDATFVGDANMIDGGPCVQFCARVREPGCPSHLSRDCEFYCPAFYDNTQEQYPACYDLFLAMQQCYVDRGCTDAGAWESCYAERRVPFERCKAGR